ncbi:FtsX-like permease family protein, partial [Candidatus Daviesbacteria bacterium]|nr:FtsX-like permease family protein [Candidatus Daviesbacteria bacterium]
SEVIVPEDVVKTLTSVTKIIRIVGAVVVSFLTIFATLVILMIIGFKIRLRRGEIEIMRLIGASSSFIRNPYVLEGMFYGVVGAASAWVIVYLLLWYFTPFLQIYLGEVKLVPVSPILMLILLGASLAVACIIGGLGSIGAVRRYLKI